MRHKLSLAVLLLLTIACAPKLGDSCDRATDCSANGDRVCDRAQPGGYCTISNCEPGSCPEEGRCVRFRASQPRLASQWCMARCSSSSDCDRDGYECRSAEELNPSPPAAPEFIVLDPKPGKFCVYKEE